MAYVYTEASQRGYLLRWKKIKGYSTRFTERRPKKLARAAYLLHPWNALSSFAFVILGVELLLHRTKYLVLVGAMNVVFGLSSFLYHATESKTVGTVDISLVFANKVAILLLQLGLDHDAATGVLTAILLAMTTHFVWTWRNGIPEKYIVVKYEYKLLVLMLAGLLTTFSVKDARAYAVFVAAYLIKLCDFALARYKKIHYSLPLQGTAAYHILSAISIYMKTAK